MKKIVSLLIIFLMFFVSGCKTTATKITTVEELDDLLGESDVLKYDIRLTDACEEGHIPGFMCMGPVSEEEKDSKIEQIITNIKTLYQNMNKKIVIIDEDNASAIYILNSLKSAGYHNLYYFDGGYNQYVALKGESFIPETGCNC